MAATSWLMMSFSSCIVCGFDSYTVLFKCPQRKIDIQFIYAMLRTRATFSWPILYVPRVLQLCWGPLCDDPEKTPYLLAVLLLCLGVCRDVFSTQHITTHIVTYIPYNSGNFWTTGGPVSSAPRSQLTGHCNRANLIRARHRLKYQSAAPCGTAFLLKFLVNYHQTLGVT